MGNDGGSIPTRRELVKNAARDPSISDVKEKLKEQLAHSWTQCPISHKALSPPIVADYSGDLYNKDAIIQFLLPVEVSSIDKTEAEKFIQGRVASLKDVVEVRFEIEHDEKTNLDRRICPVTSKELGPGTKSVYLVPCGHAFSAEAIKQVNSETCIQCGEKVIVDRDVIPILPSTEEDKKHIMDRIENLREIGLTHSLKKDKSSKKRKAKEDAVQTSDANRNGSLQPTKSDTVDKNDKTGRNGENGAATTSIAAKVTNQDFSKRQKLHENENISSLYSKGEVKDRNGNFMTRGFSIPADARHR